MAKALLLDGKPLSFTERAPRKERLIDHLRKLPAGELFTAMELAKRVNFSAHAIQLYGQVLTEFSELVGRRRLYGSPKAIAELRRQLKAQA